ncbi:MAG: hypothetical protein KDI46_08685 [Alphaproteobacteria bacterium]|nr:hypothetical protein [Alphaproteobacteria bacterium]
MVNSVSGIGGPQQASPANKAQEQKAQAQKQDEKRRAERTADKVEISKEAISLAQAEQAAKQVKDDLKKDDTLTLGLDADFESIEA